MRGSLQKARDEAAAVFLNADHDCAVFLVMTAPYAVILVQMYFFLACYPLIVSFGASKHGRDMTTKTISGAIVIGVKFLAIYFILFAAQQMAASMGEVLKDFSIAD